MKKCTLTVSSSQVFSDWLASIWRWSLFELAWIGTFAGVTVFFDQTTMMNHDENEKFWLHHLNAAGRQLRGAFEWSAVCKELYWNEALDWRLLQLGLRLIHGKLRGSQWARFMGEMGFHNLFYNEMLLWLFYNALDTTISLLIHVHVVLFQVVGCSIYSTYPIFRDSITLKQLTELRKMAHSGNVLPVTNGEIP